MDAVQMRDLMEHYGKLKGGVETCKGNIRRIKSSTFDEYIEEKTHRSTLGENRLNSGKPTNPTETLGMYGRKQFELERNFQLRSEQRRLAVKKALLWQLNSLIDRLDEKEREIIIRRYVDGVRVEELYRDFGDHDVEICGGRTIRAPFHIFVWQKKPHLEIVERFTDLPHDCKQVAVLLQQIVQRYDA